MNLMELAQDMGVPGLPLGTKVNMVSSSLPVSFSVVVWMIKLSGWRWAWGDPIVISIVDTVDVDTLSIHIN